MSERRSWTQVGGFTRTLSLAVSLRDAVTDQRPRGDPRVTVDGDEPDTVTPSGYRVFLDREADTVTVAVDGGDRYLDDEQTIDRLSHDPTDAVTFELRPAPAYQFQSGATLIRGRVTDDADEPVADATVSVQGLSRTARTDTRGAYVYFFAAGTDGEVVERGDRMVIEVAGGDPTIEATHPDHGTASASTELEEGSTAVADLKYP
jgi:hypothetical protein